MLTYDYVPQEKRCGPYRACLFFGYRRPGRQGGIRNEIWIIPTVGCVNSIAKALEN